MEVQTMATDGIGSMHTYEFALDSWMPAGDCLYPLTGVAADALDLADVVIDHERTGHGTTLHTTVRMPVTEVLGQPRPEVMQKVLTLVTTCEPTPSLW
jgi:hypothetical protein